MLRVNSLLYIEKLWHQPNLNHNKPSSILEPAESIHEPVTPEVIQDDVEPQPSNNNQVEIDIPDKIEEEEESNEATGSKRDSKFGSLEDEENNKPATDTSTSSSSSIVPPVTPSSVHSTGQDIPVDKASPRPRTTSLIRRETNKLNDRRKSLTLKLKRAISVKLSDNKRNSM